MKNFGLVVLDMMWLPMPGSARWNQRMYGAYWQSSVFDEVQSSKRFHFKKIQIVL